MTLLKTLLFTVLVPGAVIVYFPLWLLASQEGGFHLEIGSLWMLGMLPFLIGVGIYLWCAWHFTFAGQGTPAPIDPPKHLVARGPYRVVRNPMYVGVLTALLGEALLFHSLSLVIYAALVFVAVHLFVVFYEEPRLRRQFGASYQDYCAQVPRWIPRLSLWRRKRSLAG
ncbi:MAG TPA: isoprenylcysteine carboxylmethyltransferase family protein [Ktedonobacterales bacterium]|jgi:protein-S-isoprenylcysteine O-methyltransferase Ste14